MRKIMIAAIATLLIGGAGVGAVTLISQPSNETSAQSLAALQTASFNVENMTCATCPITVRRAMEGVSGVQEVAVDYSAKTAIASFDPEVTSATGIAQASTDAGYPAILKESEL